MKIKDYIKDKLYFIIIFLTVFIFMNFFLIFIEVNTSIIIMIDLSYLIIFTSLIGVEFFRRYKYYNSLLETIQELDQKYLIFDLIEPKDFLDSNILNEVLREGNISMNREIAKYKDSQVEYKEYVELWVHEIKTPLSALDLMIENNNISKAKNELDRLSYYIDQALYYARSNSVEKDYIIESVNLETSCKKVIRDLSNNFIEKNIKIDFDFASDDVYSDIKWLEFIIKQILINSVQYSNPNSSVTINTYNLENSIILEIKDQGIGIKESDLPRIFEKGFTGTSGRLFNQATGMGLYLVKKLSEALYIKVSARSDEETVFTLQIPKSRNHFPI